MHASRINTNQYATDFHVLTLTCGVGNGRIVGEPSPPRCMQDTIQMYGDYYYYYYYCYYYYYYYYYYYLEV